MYKDNPQKIIATVEARMTSSRLPGKVLMDFCGKPALMHIIERLKDSKYLDDVVIATTMNSTDDPVIKLCEMIDCNCYRGSEADVLLRVLEAAKSNEAEIIVEITGDCPIVDSTIVDQAIELFFLKDCDYLSNGLETPYPNGCNVQIFPTHVLEEVNAVTLDPLDHEHVSLYIYRHPQKYKIYSMKAPKSMQYNFEITLDTPEDYKMIKLIYDELYPINPKFSAQDVINLLLRRKDIADIVKKVKRTVVPDNV